MFDRRAFQYFIVFAIIFAVLSMPFLLGIMRPSFGERSPYAILFAFINLPVTYVFGDVIHWLAEQLWESPTNHQHDVAECCIAMLFWSIAGMVIGFWKDFREGGSR